MAIPSTMPRDVVVRARERFSRTAQPLLLERRQAIEDRRFVFIAGRQWDGSLLNQFDNKPRPEINKIAMGLKRIKAEYAQNEMSVEFRSKAVHYDKDESGELLSSLLRSDERFSGAQEAYDNAFTEGSSGGYGAWRYRVDYEDQYDEDSELRISIEPIYDADLRVFFDLGAKRYDKADARYAFIIYAIPVEEYQEQWGKTSASSFFALTEYRPLYDWYQPEVVYVCEYYEINEKKVTCTKWKNPITGEEAKYDTGELDAEDEADMMATGWEVVSKRRVTRRECRKWIIDGDDILEGGEKGERIPGGMIPIVPYYGQRVFLDNIERCQGYVRITKDAQRLYNMQVSLLEETAALSPIQKPIVPIEMIKGHEMTWARDNIERFPFLPINVLKNADGSIAATGPTAYTQPPQISPGLQGIIQLADSDLKELTGSAEQAEKVIANTSAEAIQLVQNQVGMYTYTYLDNMRKSMQRGGEIYAQIAREVYGEKRVMTVVNQEGDEERVELMTEGINMETGLPELQNDITKTKWDVIVDVGPSTTSKKDQTVKNCIAILQALGPQSPYSNAIAGTMLENMEGEGMERVREFAHKTMLQQGVIEPQTDEDKEYMQQLQQQQAQQPPDAQSQALMAMAQKEQAAAIKATADTELVKAKTMEVFASLDESQQRLVMEQARLIMEGRQQDLDNQFAMHDRMQPKNAEM